MRILLLADIHLGSIKDTSYVYDVITSILDNEIVLTKTDAVIILGDLFHRSFRVNEEYTKLAMNVISYLVQLCRKTKTKLRMIYGTESHDCGQYVLAGQYLSDKSIDMKVINTVTTEELFPGTKVLYVPEEYITSIEEHYGKAFSEHYDYVFGHGIIQEGMPMVGPDNQSNTEKKVPRFKAGQLASIGGITVFGHYHCFTDMGNNVYYLGSLFRDSFGEEAPKGYGVIEDSKFNFVENKEAYVYRSYEYPEDSKIYSDVELIKTEIDRIKSENSEIFSGKKYGKIRMVFKLPIGTDSSFLENLRSMLFNERGITTLIKEQTTAENELVSSVALEYDFILDKSLPITDKIYRYINKTYPDADITLEELAGFINDDLKI